MERVYHTFDEWECLPAGFYDNHPPHGITEPEARRMHAAVVEDVHTLAGGIALVVDEWVNSVEHYMTNDRMNRLRWLINAGVTRITGIGRKYGQQHYSEEAQRAALDQLNRWLTARGEDVMDLETARGRTEMDLY